MKLAFGVHSQLRVIEPYPFHTSPQTHYSRAFFNFDRMCIVLKVAEKSTSNSHNSTEF